MVEMNTDNLMQVDEPTNLDPLIASRREEILDLAARRRARSLRLFGSFARGEAHAGSDVDVVEPDALHWYIRERVLQEAIPL